MMVILLPSQNSIQKKIFLWLVENGAISRKDYMNRRKSFCDTSCQLCEGEEIINHMLFECAVARVVWGIVAKCIWADNIPCNLN
jgi:hypothetical protein